MQQISQSVVFIPYKPNVMMVAGRKEVVATQPEALKTE